MRKERICPACSKVLDGATEIEETIDFDADANDVMKPGDLSICVYCATILVLEESDSFRRATPEEHDNALEDETTGIVYQAIVKRIQEAS